MLLDSLDRLPSISVNNSENFSLSNEEMLLSQKEISLKSIHLLSDYSFAIQTDKETVCLNQQDSFTKYPIASKQTYTLENQGIEVNQLVIFSRNKSGVTILNYIKNVDRSAKNFKFLFQANTNLKSTGWTDKKSEEGAPDQISFDQITAIFTAKDEVNNYFAVWGSTPEFSLIPADSDCFEKVTAYGASAGFEISVELAGNEELVIPTFIAGSDQREYSAIETLASLRTDLFSDWDESFALIDSLQNTSKITIPEQELQEAYEWSKYKVGVIQFEVGNINPAPLSNPEELNTLLKELSQNFSYQLDKNIFSFDENKPRHIQPGWELLQPMTLHMLGIYGDVANRVTYIRPNLPTEWKEASIENLWIDDNKLTIEITSDENQMTVEITQTQKSAGLSIELPAEFSKVKLLGKEVSTDTKDGYRRILMTGDHVKITAEKN